MSSAIQAELQKITGVKVITPRQDFLDKLIKAAHKLEEDVWESISQKAQKWVNDGAEAFNSDAAIPEFPDIKAAGAEDAEKDTTNMTTKAKTSKKPEVKNTTKGKKGAEQPPAKKAPEKADAKKKTSGAIKDTGIKVQIKKLVFAKPSVTTDELVEKLSKTGKVSRLTVASVRSEFRHSLRVLVAAAALKNNDIEF